MHTFKILSTVTVLTAIVIGFCLYTLNTLESTSEILDDHINKIQSSLEVKDWDKAAEEMSKFEEKWSSTNITWAMLLDHLEIDNIDTSFTRLSKFIEARNLPLAMGEAAVLKQYVQHIPEKEGLRWQNIL